MYEPQRPKLMSSVSILSRDRLEQESVWSTGWGVGKESQGGV